MDLFPNAKQGHSTRQSTLEGCITVPQPATCRAEEQLGHLTAIATGPKDGLTTHFAARDAQVSQCPLCVAVAFPEALAGILLNCSPVPASGTGRSSSAMEPQAH